MMCVLFSCCSRHQNSLAPLFIFAVFAFLLAAHLFCLQRIFFLFAVHQSLCLLRFPFLFSEFVFCLQRSFLFAAHIFFVCSAPVSLLAAVPFFVFRVRFLFAAFFFVCSVSLVGYRTIVVERGK